MTFNWCIYSVSTFALVCALKSVHSTYIESDMNFWFGKIRLKFILENKIDPASNVFRFTKGSSKETVLLWQTVGVRNILNVLSLTNVPGIHHFYLDGALISELCCLLNNYLQVHNAQPNCLCYEKYISASKNNFIFWIVQGHWQPELRQGYKDYF